MCKRTFEVMTTPKNYGPHLGRAAPALSGATLSFYNSALQLRITAI